MGLWIVQLCAGLSVAAAQQFPAWTAPWLDPLIIPYGGSSLAANVSHASVFRATLQLGTYNMAPMFDYFNGSFLVTWKNSPQVRAPPCRLVACVAGVPLHVGVHKLLKKMDFEGGIDTSAHTVCHAQRASLCARPARACRAFLSVDAETQHPKTPFF